MKFYVYFLLSNKVIVKSSRTGVVFENNECFTEELTKIIASEVINSNALEHCQNSNDA